VWERGKLMKYSMIKTIEQSAQEDLKKQTNEVEKGFSYNEIIFC
jgi:hypothetical protein